MNKINLDTWIQLLGMLGVIASLIFVQYSQGLMTEPVWQAKLRAMEVNLKRCEYPEIYQVRSQLVEKEFKRILDSMPSQCED